MVSLIERVQRQPTYIAQLMARAQRESILSGSEWLLPLLESRPANTMGSRPPSSSGSATWATHTPQQTAAVQCTRLSLQNLHQYLRC